MPRLKATLAVLSLATASVPATLAAQSTYGAVPGSLNFVQGQANIDGQPLQTNNTAANQPRVLHTGETLATANGSADILMAPGALLRIGKDSTVRVVAENATRTEIRLEQGIANVSVNVVRHDDLLLVDLPQGQTQLLSRGLYTFNTETNTLRVFHGEADVFPGTDTSTDVKPVKVKEGHEALLTGERVKPASFDTEMADGDLLPWTGPREGQAALADGTPHRSGGYSSAGYYGGGGYGYGFAGPAFYGDPFLAYDSPYGWGYPYGPYGFGGYPFFGVGFYGGGFYGGGVYGGRGFVGRGPGIPIKGPGHLGYVGGGRAAFAGGGFGGGRSFGGGGFHGGGGGFHGGGGGRR